MTPAPDHTPTAFPELLARAGRGDEAAIAELVGRCGPQVRAAAAAASGPAVRPYLDSADLCRTVRRCVRLGLRSRRYDVSDPDKLVSLAVTTLRRRAARGWRLRRHHLTTAIADPDALADLLTSLSAPVPSGDARFRDEVRHLCHLLDETDRRVLDLRSRDRTTAAVAADLGLSPVALRVRLTRLRQRLAAAGVVIDWL
jgi:RNA polymerase sigma factor (sigma-70 family)